MISLFNETKDSFDTRPNNPNFIEKPDFFTASEKLKDLAVVLFNKYTENGGTHPFSCLIIEPFSSSFKEEIIK